MLRWENISHRFGFTDVLEDINIELEKGKVISLVGPSGCGKSTLLNIAADLFDPTEGELINTFERLSIVFQDHRLLPWRRGIDNIAYGPYPVLPVSSMDQRAGNGVENCGDGRITIDHRWHRRRNGPDAH